MFHRMSLYIYLCSVVYVYIIIISRHGITRSKGSRFSIDKTFSVFTSKILNHHYILTYSVCECIFPNSYSGFYQLFYFCQYDCFAIFKIMSAGEPIFIG